MLITILIQLNFIFYKADNLTYKFTAKDSSYNIKLNKDYVESFKINLDGKKIASNYCLSEEKEGYRLNIDNQNYYLVKTNEFDWANYEDSNFE